MKKILFTLFILLFVLFANAQVGRFMGGGGFLFLNNYVNFKDNNGNTVNAYGSLFNANTSFGFNAVYLTNNQSISFAIEPFYSAGFSNNKDIVHHLALPIMAKYNLGFLSTNTSDNKWGFSAGAGFTKHWFFGELKQISKWQPTVSVAVRHKAPKWDINLFDYIGKDKQVQKYRSWEFVIMYGFLNEMVTLENPSPPKFTWLYFAWRIYLTKDTLKPNIKLGY